MLSRRTSASPFTSKRPTYKRCGRSSFEPTGSGGTSCLTETDAYLSPSSLITGRRVFTPAVRSQVLTQAVKSFPHAASSSVIKSLSSVFL